MMHKKLEAFAFIPTVFFFLSCGSKIPTPDVSPSQPPPPPIDHTQAPPTDPLSLPKDNDTHISTNEAISLESKIWTEFPLPEVSPLPNPVLNDEKTCLSYILEANDDLISRYEKKLESQDFIKLKDPFLNGYEKISDKTPLIVLTEQGEGEYVLKTCISRDPQNRYAQLPDKSIPYPLEYNALASEYAQVILPDGDSKDTIYIFFNKPETFVRSYTQQLIDAGFTQNDTSLSFTKIHHDNTVSSVILELKDKTELRIKMRHHP